MIHKRENKGFTLIEMIVAMAILTIMLSLSVSGMLQWQDWSDFNRENEYAQSLFIAAQNQLSEFAADGRLEDFKAALAESSGEDESGLKYKGIGLNITDNISQIKDCDGNAYDMQKLFPQSYGKTEPKLYQNEILSLRAETGDYEEYLSNPKEFMKSNPEAYWVFELVGAYVYDSSILNGDGNKDGGGNGAAICIEITPDDGQVFSVMYSDKNDKFIYLGMDGDTHGKNEDAMSADICDRTENYRRSRMVGYYGVDSLYKATKNEMVRPSLAFVKLYNKDTFYMTYKLSSKYERSLTQQLSYVMDLNNSKNVNDKKITITLDGSKLHNKEHANTIDCPVVKYDAAGNEIVLGEFPVLAWIENDFTIHVVWDAADVQATTFVYGQELEDICSDDENVSSSTRFSQTYSFFRFGVKPGNVYASVKATGAGYTDSKIISNFNNLNPLKNQGERHTCFAGESTSDDSKAYTYSVNNARHLYNIRYTEGISYADYNKAYASVTESVTFKLKSDIDWSKFQKEGQLYNSYSKSGIFQLSSLDNKLTDVNGTLIESVTNLNCGFPSIAAVRTEDVIDGNDKTIKGISVAEISNALFGNYNKIKDRRVVIGENRPTGFVNVNYGTIKNLKLDSLTSFGANIVGGFCGINAGVVTNLTLLNSKDTSLVSGRKNVGGVIGFQMPTDENLIIEKLTNRAPVFGVEAVGGIVGMMRNEFSLVNVDELTGLSDKTKQLLDDSNDFSITLRECKNYGFVSGVNSSLLYGIYKEDETSTVNAETLDPEEARYIGGIAGYCYNRYASDESTDRIKIEQCTSSPQYGDEKLTDILADGDKLTERLKGVYVGGITGYNFFSEINNCNTDSDSGQEGYLFGYKYVGGIVGFNIGPASGIIGSDKGGQGTNNNHVIAYEYAGGITGCNSGVMDKDSLDNKLLTATDMDPEKLEGILIPDMNTNLKVKIEKWINKGVVIATNKYSGGITGYNTGYIYSCNSIVEADIAEKYFNTLCAGDFAGGIAGYNNGIIGNTKRIVSSDGKKATIASDGEKFATVCYVKGHNYVGGIVGYNDVDSIVEDYSVSSGYVSGDDGSCFVGGYAGLNASASLLMNTEAETPEARFIYSNPNSVEGSYFVGGSIGGNIINTKDLELVKRKNEKNDAFDAADSVEPDYVYAEFTGIGTPWTDGEYYYSYPSFVVYNNTTNKISSWTCKPWSDDSIIVDACNGNGIYNPSTKTFEYNYQYACDIAPGGTASASCTLKSKSLDALNALTGKKFPVTFFAAENNKPGTQLGVYKGAAFCSAVLSVENGWSDNNVTYTVALTNTSNIVMPCARVDFDLPEGAVVNWTSCDKEFNGNVFGIYTNHHNYTLPGNTTAQYNFNITFNNAADKDKFTNTKPRLYFNSVLYAGGVLDNDESGNMPGSGNTPGSDTYDEVILAQFKSDNFLGLLSGKEFVGGFIGYNLLIENSNTEEWVNADNEDKEKGAVYVLQKKLVEEFNASDVTYSNDLKASLYDKKGILDDVNGRLGTGVITSDKLVEISGERASATTTSFGSICGEIFVGGVVGYNDNETRLNVINVENATPIEGSSAIECEAEQPGRATDYAGNDFTYTYSYTGGVIGKVSRKTTLDNCWNAPTGAVYSVGTYTGGLCEINEGNIKNCLVSNFGNSTTDYVGGICGLNKNEIINCVYEDKTVSGRNVVGGIVAENFGIVSDIELVNSKMIVSGISDGKRDGVCGLYAGYNGSTGNIILEKDISDVEITSGGRYAGAVVGYNEGCISNSKDTEYYASGNNIDRNLEVSGVIEGYKSVGGLIGCNNDADDTRIIHNYTNKMQVKATNGNVGGIIGENTSANSIHNCVNASVVTATDAGNAGGITSVNYSTIENCYNYKAIKAPKGKCGGIVAINGNPDLTEDENELAIIKNCTVTSDTEDSLVFESSLAVGGITAENSGIIYNNSLINVEVSNYSGRMGTDIGVVAGRNYDMGKILLSDSYAIQNCKAVINSNNSNAGGIAGLNKGLICPNDVYEDADSTTLTKINSRLTLKNATYGNLGGVAGVNTGIIMNISVFADIEGNLGSDSSGYGGIAGYSGYTKLANVPVTEDTAYPVIITNCTFDGKVHAIGSSGAPARIGGVVGINGYGSMIEECSVGAYDEDINGNSSEETRITELSAGDTSLNGMKPSETDTQSYVNLGGITGENYGYILACDNAANSMDSVKIIGFTGETSGIAGYNYEGGIITGYVDEDGNTRVLSTGKNWTVEQRCAENDHGPGGIIGINYSTESINYVDNYADVTCIYPTNNKAGGFIGAVGQDKAYYIEINNCNNYGNVRGNGHTGGFVGYTRIRGINFNNCTNYGNVYSQVDDVGGFLGCRFRTTTGVNFYGCKNHGSITLAAKATSKGIGGFLGESDSPDGNYTNEFYDCVNTGIITREGVNTATNKIGSFIGIGNGNNTFEICRNYNTAVCANGFVGEGGNSRFKNCFDSSNTVTTDVLHTPFSQRNPDKYSGLYTFDKNEKISPVSSISHKNYGVYYTMYMSSNHNLKMNGYNYSDLKNPEVFFMEPSESNTMDAASKTITLNFNLYYDNDSEGIDSFVTYFWNGNNNPTSTTVYDYTASAEFIYDDNHIETASGSGRGAYYLSDGNKMIIKNPSSVDKRPKTIRITYSCDDANVYLRGFTYIPYAEAKNVQAGALATESKCMYLAEKHDTRFNIAKVKCTNASSGQRDMTIRYSLPSGVVYRAPCDIMNIEWTSYSNFRVEASYGEEVSLELDVKNGNNPAGLDSFVFYLGNDNTNPSAAEKDIQKYYYKYYVEFIDEYDNVVKSEEVSDAEGSNDINASRQVVKVPAGLNSNVCKIVLHIQTEYRIKGTKKETTGGSNPGRVYFRGFSWIPKNETREWRMVAGADSYSTCSVIGGVYGGNSSYINRLLVDYNTANGKPYIYSPGSYSLGFYMDYASNDPLADKYLNDTTDYNESITASKDSGSRIDTYIDIDDKMVGFMKRNSIIYKKLATPRDLKISDFNGHYRFTWSPVADAYAYEVKYKVVDASGKSVLGNEYSDSVIRGSMICHYEVEMLDEWLEQGCSIEFSIRTLNAYHFTEAVNNECYDSDWVNSAEKVVRQKLIEPQMHLEIVSGNRTTFVLDNYDEYVEKGCDDCTIVVSLNNKNYEWDLSQHGKYRTPEYIALGYGSDTSIRLYAKPNDSIKDKYMDSPVYRSLFNAFGNNALIKEASYCPVSFTGFAGTDVDNMTYGVSYQMNTSLRDAFQIADISTFDNEVGATVSYSVDTTHTANSTSTANLTITASLKNLPEKWFAADCVDKITVRSYLYRSQFEYVHYGHDVATGIRLDGTVEKNQKILADIVDYNYIGENDTAPMANNIWDGNDLKAGYILIRQEDGTYNIIYNATIEMSKKAARETNEPYREYLNYAVAYKIYSNIAKETAADITVNSADFRESYWVRNVNCGVGNDFSSFNNVKIDSNELKFVNEIQEVPILNGSVVASSDEDGHTVYKLAWDKYYQDAVCWDASNNRYSGDRSNSTSRLTNVPENLVETWDEYSLKAGKAGIDSVDNYYSNGFNNSYRRKMMNSYYDNYSNASYKVVLIGTTLDGQRAILETKNVTEPTSLGTISSYELEDGTIKDLTTLDNRTLTSYNLWDYECSFTDSNNAWNKYPIITARVIRLGEKTSVSSYDYNQGKKRTAANGATYILPRYADFSVTQKQRLSTIAKPDVNLAKDDGKFNTTSLAYTVEWGGITNTNQLQDLGGYMVTVSLKKAADDSRVTPTHYYYVRDIGIEENVKLAIDIDELYQNGIVEEIQSGMYSKTGDMRKAVIDLSDFNTGDRLLISVRAIAKEASVNYENGADGIANEIVVPNRIKTPLVDKLSLVVDGEGAGMPSYEDAVVSRINPDDDSEEIFTGSVDMNTYKKGVSFKYDSEDERYKSEKTARIVLSAAIYDEVPEGMLNDTTKHTGADATEEAEQAGYWNSGAVKTIYFKSSPLDLGYAYAGGVKNIDITRYEKYPGEYAGKWLKIALKATSATRIDSQWSDQDMAGETINYLWIHLPNLVLDNVDLREMDAVDSETGAIDGITRYYYDNSIHDDEPEDENVVSVNLVNKSLQFTEDKNLDGYNIYIVGKERLMETDGNDQYYIPSYNLYLQKHFALSAEEDEAFEDGTWDVFLAAANDKTGITDAVEKDADARENANGFEIAVCGQNEEAYYIGNIGSAYDGEASDTEQIIDLKDIEAVMGAYDVYAQLRYIPDGQNGKLVVVLPDVIAVEDSDYRANYDYFATMQLMLQPYISAPDASCTIGYSKLFSRIEPENAVSSWTTGVSAFSDAGVAVWLSNIRQMETALDNMQVEAALLNIATSTDAGNR